MPTVKKFEELEIWQLARKIENKVFEQSQTESFKADYRLKNQINDASSSIMSNIAEGFGRGSRLEFINILSYAKGSGAEVQSQLDNCLDRKYIAANIFDEIYQMLDLLCKKISSFMSYLNQTEMKGQKFMNRKNNP